MSQWSPTVSNKGCDGVEMGEIRAAIWVRVSSAPQYTENQLPDLYALAQRRRMKVVEVYELHESAWYGAHKKVLSQVYQDARRHTVGLGVGPPQSGGHICDPGNC